MKQNNVQDGDLFHMLWCNPPSRKPDAKFTTFHQHIWDVSDTFTLRYEFCVKYMKQRRWCPVGYGEGGFSVMPYDKCVVKAAFKDRTGKTATFCFNDRALQPEMQIIVPGEITWHADRSDKDISCPFNRFNGLRFWLENDQVRMSLLQLPLDMKEARLMPVTGRNQFRRKWRKQAEIKVSGLCARPAACV